MSDELHARAARFRGANDNRDATRETRRRFLEALRDGLDCDEAADVANRRDPVEKPKGSVEIPEDWATLHWRKKVSLAEAISGAKIVGDDPKGQAEAILAAAVS